MSKTLSFVILVLVFFSTHCLKINKSKICPCTLVNKEDSFVQKYVSVGSFVQKIVNIDRPQPALLQKAVFVNTGRRDAVQTWEPVKSTTPTPEINKPISSEANLRRAVVTEPIKTIPTIPEDDLEVEI